MLKKVLIVLTFTFFALPVLWSQDTQAKYALVIGNGAYTGLNRLANPTNDATDVAAALEGLGFTVDKLLNGSLDQMEEAVMKLKNRLRASGDAYGFFFYAGHGVQSGGENFLIPVDASIPSENFLRSRSVSVQVVLDELNDARNKLNVVVLDACRDNPFSWGRSASGRGLAMITRQPADSIIVYATSAGQQAIDGTDRNGLFTSQLLNNLKNPSLEVTEVFRRTGADVSEVSGRQQVPAIYNQFFGTAYLGAKPSSTVPAVFRPGEVSQATGSLEILTITAGIVEISGGALNQRIELPAYGQFPVEEINAGTYIITIRYEDGKVEEKTVEVGRSETKKVEFNYRPPVAKPAKAPRVRAEKPQAEARTNSEASRLWTLGASLGTSLSAPWVITTVHGTIAPFDYSFLELGFDIGFVEGSTEAGYNSFYPYAHYAFFLPFEKIGLYAGAGGGVMIVSYDFFDKGGKYSETIPVVSITAGVNILNIIDVSYTVRTNFTGVSPKLSAGYTYRF